MLPGLNCRAIPAGAIEQLECHISKQLDGLKAWLDVRFDRLESESFESFNAHALCGLEARLDDRLKLIEEHVQKTSRKKRVSFDDQNLIHSSEDGNGVGVNTILSKPSPPDGESPHSSNVRGNPSEHHSNAPHSPGDRQTAVDQPAVLKREISQNSEDSAHQRFRPHPWWSNVLSKPHVPDTHFHNRIHDADHEADDSTDLGAMVRKSRESDAWHDVFGSEIEDAVTQGLISPVVAKLMMHPSSVWRLAWVVLGMLLIIYDVVTIPVLIAFAPPETDDVSIGLRLFTAVYWTIDILLTFLVGYWKAGFLEVRPRKVAVHYLRSWLVFDVALVGFDWATIIWDEMQSARMGRTVRVTRSLRTLRSIRSLRLLRLLKLKRIMEEVRDSISSEYVHISIDISRNVMAIMFLNHILACVWFGIGVDPPSGQGGWVEYHNLGEESIDYQYASSLHWSLTQFTPASMEVYPRNFQERTFAVSAVVIALIVFSSFISSITTAMIRVRELHGDTSTQFWLLRRYLKEHKVSPQLTVRIKRYLEFQTSRKQRLLNPKNIELLSELPEHLHRDLEWEKTCPVLTKHPFFSHYSACDELALGDICDSAIHHKFLTTGDLLFTQGMSSEGMFFVIRGSLEYFKKSLVMSPAVTMIGRGGLVRPQDRSVSQIPSESTTGRHPGNVKVARARNRVKLHAWEYCCEAALWVPWVHTGTMISTSIGEVAEVNAESFKSVSLKHMSISVITARYALKFAQDLNELGPDQSTDLAENFLQTTNRASEAFGEIANLDRRQVKALEEYTNAIEDRDAKRLGETEIACIELKVPAQELQIVQQMHREKSEEAGVSLAYVLSEDFHEMVRKATGKEDPTFLEMKDPFFLNPPPGQKLVGEGMLCPRDLKIGCSFVDMLATQHREEANTFLSWVWQYNLSTIRSGLSRWAIANNLEPASIYMYMCFFCNNQWRIMVEKCTQGSDNLGTVFEERLVKIGKAVALLDSWNDSVYTRRIWTIYEQYIATKVGVKMEFTLPHYPATTLIHELERGNNGIQHVIDAISIVDAENAEATIEDDERKVKSLIRESIGFDAVNKQVKSNITTWIATEFKANIDRLVQTANSSDSLRRNRRSVTIA